MKSFLRALAFCKPYWFRIAMGIACAFASTVFFVFSIGSLGPMGALLFDEPAKTVRYVHTSWPTPQDPKTWVLEYSDQWEIKEDPAQENFTVQGNTVNVRPDLPRRKVEGALQAMMAKMTGPTLGPYIGKIIGILPTDRWRALLWISLAAIVATIARGALRYANEYLVGYATNRAMLALRLRAYDHVLRSQLSVYAKTGTGEITSRFQNDCTMIHEGLKVLLGKIVSEPFRLIACLAAAVYIGIQIDPWLPVIVLGVIPINTYLVRRLAKQMRTASRKALESWAQLLAILEESLFGIRVVKGYRLEGYMRRRFFKNGRRLFRQVLKAIRIDAITEPIVETIFTIMGVGALLLAGKIIIDKNLGQEGIGLLTTFFMFLVGAMDPGRKLTNVVNRMEQAAAGSERVFKLMDEPKEPRYGTHGLDLQRLSQALEFRNVSFTYPTGGEVLHGISLSVRHDEVVAIVGRTGCGKTTLVSLIPRFFEPSCGQILIDGIDIREVTLRSLRSQIAVVPQETVLFTDTVAQNIALGGAQNHSSIPGRSRIETAAAAAHADAFIRAMPQGYDTVIGERGSTLSGGERQRMALARAIVRDPAILILDEATSSLDEETQSLVQDTLKTFVKGRTTILIAHRLTTLAIADRIVVMDAGRIIGAGTHEELMASCPLYRRLREVGLDNA
jgi:ATP-binding cassette, subfamily B, bacterial MsbA